MGIETVKAEVRVRNEGGCIVKFKFSLGERVEVAAGATNEPTLFVPGVIRELGLDLLGERYYVEANFMRAWYGEKHLRKIGSLEDAPDVKHSSEGTHPITSR